MMKGITKEELYNDLKENHEAEFIYKNKVYVIQPEVDGGKEYLSIYYGKKFIRVELLNKKIDDECINNLFNTKFVDGKCFNDIEEDVEVTVVY